MEKEIKYKKVKTISKYLVKHRIHANVSKSHRSMVGMGGDHRNDGRGVRGHGHGHVHDLKMAEVAHLVFSLARNPAEVYQ